MLLHRQSVQGERGRSEQTDGTCWLSPCAPCSWKLLVATSRPGYGCAADMGSSQSTLLLNLQFSTEELEQRIQEYRKHAAETQADQPKVCYGLCFSLASPKGFATLGTQQLPGQTSAGGSVMPCRGRPPRAGCPRGSHPHGPGAGSLSGEGARQGRCFWSQGDRNRHHETLLLF